MMRFKAFSTPKAIVYVPFLPAVATCQMLWRGKQEAEHKQFNPMNPVNPVKKIDFHLPPLKARDLRLDIEQISVDFELKRFETGSI